MIGTQPVGYTGDKDALLKRMKRIEGQVRGIHRMIEGDDYCIDVITQVSAVTSALESVALLLLQDHVSHCVVDAARSGDDERAQQKIDEVNQAVKRLVKS